MSTRNPSLAVTDQPEAEVLSQIWEPDEEGDARIVEILEPGQEGELRTEEEEREFDLPEEQDGDSEELRAKLVSLREAIESEGDAVFAAAPRAFAPSEIRAEDEEKRILRFVLSTEDVGRDGDIIRAKGWQLAPFRKNPVWLWSHDRWSPPIGRVVEIVKDLSRKVLEASVQFADAEINPFADMVYRLHRAKFLRGVSVSWLPLRVTRPDDEMRKELSLGPWGVVFEKVELLESSSVTVPADRKALMKSVGVGAVRGLLGTADLELASRTLGESERETDREAFEALEEAWRTLHRVVVSESTIHRLSAVAERMEQNAGARTSDEDTPEPSAPDGDVPGRRDLYADLFEEEDEAVRRLDAIAQRMSG